MTERFVCAKIGVLSTSDRQQSMSSEVSYMTASAWLAENFRTEFRLPEVAIEWLLMLWQATQTFDDVADGDPVSREELNATIWNTLVAMNRNEFWLLHQSTLTPIVASVILKWQASDRA
ncbi:MAG: hypothetical protein B7Z23_04420 [Pseudomonadales bacterium 32-61-5]|nr:MAG: hypothetical protein B7Z23_04420 [Pseudomonadales bacterium 32-61-5]